jgi:hypothetical protein
MDNSEAKELVDSVYSGIIKSKSIEEIKEIWKYLDNKKSDSFETTYPRIHFKLDQTELQFIYNRIISNQPIINPNSDLKSPIEKLLYAMVWKNGDLLKLKHIVMGVFDEMPAYKENEGVVLYYFGRYLTNPNANSIIDQHVIRTYKLYVSKDEKEFDEARKFNGVKKKHEEDVKGYLNWLTTNIKEPLKSNHDTLYEIDKLLFSLGKIMKLK